ncbi:MAG: sulfotransferase [Cyanobacteria bacterium J06639_14]
MQDPLIILSPPRSFSSVVSTVIGEHPDIYGFPELHLFSGRTVEDIIRREEKAGNAGPPGLLRTIAQEHYGIQTANTLLKATIWFRERRHWPTKKLFDYLLELVNPKMGLEKSPETAGKVAFLERSYTWFPKAYYLHLTRHPVSARKSIQAFYEEKKKRKNLSLKYQVDGLIVWYTMHRNIINFTNTLPTGQVMRIKGEDLLSDPDLYLPQIAEWLGLRTDGEVIEAMKHPENSPYAYVGPPPVRGGNDPKFMRNPHLRTGKVQEPSLKDFWKNQNWQWASDELRGTFEEANIDFIAEEDLVSNINHLSHLMGYQ